MKTFAGRKLTRKPGHRKWLLKNLTLALLQHEKIQTTFPKAKELSRFAEKVITMAKKGGLHAQRQVLKVVHQDLVRKKIFEVLVPRYESRNGGYTQVIKTMPRAGDAAPMAVVRLLP